MKVSDLTRLDFECYIENVGKRANTTIRILARLYPYIENVVETEPGASILEEDILRHENLLMKLYNDNITDMEKAELNYLKRRIEIIAKRIKLFKEKQSQIKGGTNE